MTLFEQSANGRQQILIERRVEKHQIERRGRLGFQIAQGVGSLYLAGGAAQGAQMFLDAGYRNVAGIQCLAHCCATGQSLEKQRAATGKWVEHLGPGDIRREPVEQGFTDSVRRWTQAWRIREAQLSAAPFTADDAQLIHTVMYVVNRFFSGEWPLMLRNPERLLGRFICGGPAKAFVARSGQR